MDKTVTKSVPRKWLFLLILIWQPCRYLEILTGVSPNQVAVKPQRTWKRNLDLNHHKINQRFIDTKQENKECLKKMLKDKNKY